MAETLQKRLLRMDSEILALKSSQTKPASLRAFYTVAQNVASGEQRTIHFEGDYDFAPIVQNDVAVILLPYDSATNSQDFISEYAGTATIHFVSSRPISSIS